MTDLAVDCALQGIPGVIGHDEERGDVPSNGVYWIVNNRRAQKFVLAATP